MYFDVFKFKMSTKILNTIKWESSSFQINELELNYFVLISIILKFYVEEFQTTTIKYFIVGQRHIHCTTNTIFGHAIITRKLIFWHSFSNTEFWQTYW